MIDKKSKTIAAKMFISMTFSARKIFEIVFSAETLRNEVSKSEMIERMTMKNEKNIETMNKKHLQEFEKEKKSKKVTSIETSSSRI